METVTAKTKQRTTARGRLEVERRWVIRDIGWDDYEELGKLLPPTVPAGLRREQPGNHGHRSAP